MSVTHPSGAETAHEPEAGLAGAVAQVCDIVCRHVASGRWPGGYTLTEADLVQQIGVSRSTVREALRRLESEGLVVKKRSRNLVVRRLSRRDVDELYELREVLEGHAAGKAAARFGQLSQPEQAAFMSLLEWWDAAPTRGNGEALSAANASFHAAILQMAGNQHLPRILGGTLMTLFVSQFRSRLSTDSGLDAARYHVGLAHAIIKGDAAAAEQLMREHVRNSAALIQALPDDAFEAESA